MKTKLILLSLSFFCGFVSIAQVDDFVPEDPDTAYLRPIARKTSVPKSLAELYLEKYYALESDLDSVRYFEWSEKEICAYRKKYSSGIVYKVDVCSEEGGGGETLYFPRMKTQVAKIFVEKLFFDLENTWQNELNYAPEGVGCYYQIIQTENYTIINTYCGC